MTRRETMNTMRILLSLGFSTKEACVIIVLIQTM